MPTSLYTGARLLNVGHDMVSVMLTQNGHVVPNLMVTSFSSGQNNDGSWHGEICLDRTSAHLEHLATIDPVFWILTRVRDPDGAEIGFTYPEARLLFREAGCYVADQFVSQHISFTSAERLVT